MADKNRKNTQTSVNIYLTGFMCAGKTSTGKALARLLKRKFADSDRLVEKQAGIKIAELVDTKGLRAFRKLEAGAVRALAGKRGLAAALGGGIYPSRRWAGLLKSTGVTVYLHCAWPELEKRLKIARDLRPRLSGHWEQARKRANKLYSKRLPFYRLADLEINAGRLTPAQTAALIARKLNIRKLRLLL
ncbi:MAG: hypothetical protein NTX59_07420 [Elusimicrobia bacterium]|nr:hypothetical protein [Elusimicrobiota bacterium]